MLKNKNICPRCNGKGIAKLKDSDKKDIDMTVKCPSCNGTGYLNTDFLDSTEENVQIKEEISNKQNIEISKENKILILKQIIKNSDLFLNGIKLLFKDENTELFIYLQNQNIFEIENQIDGMLIKLKQEYKNSLAKQCIDYLTKKI